MKIIILVILEAVLKLGLFIQTLFQVIIIIALAIQRNTTESANHSHPGCCSMTQKEPTVQSVVKMENITPARQNKSASNIAPAVFYFSLSDVRSKFQGVSSQQD